MTENPPVTTVTASRTNHPDAWRLNVLGPVELCYDGRPVEVAGPTRTLLALLARTPCEEVNTATLVAGLWGSEPPEDPEKEVASHVSRLRKALTVVAPDVDPTSVVVTLPAGYILAIQPSNADILAFERLAADGRRAIAVGQPALGLSRIDAALAMWRGQAYEDFGEHAFARAEASRLEELRLAAIESRVDAVLAVAAPHAPAQLEAELQELLDRHWHRERLWGQLMIVLFRLGRRAEALAAHRLAQEMLSERLRVQPGSELREIERAVLDSHASLYGAPPRPGSVPAALATTVPACVGRDEEANWLLSALDLAATRRAQARLVVGSAGIGKTRLLAEVAQRAAARGAVVRHWRAEATGLDTLVAPADRLSLVIVEDLDQANHEELGRVVGFIRAAMTRPVVTIISCRDPVRVGDLQGVPKLVLSALDDTAVAEIVRIYAPAVADSIAAAAMVNTGGVPARVHRAASEWAFARAGRRIDRAVADAAEPRRALAALYDEVVAGALELSHVRARARLLRPVTRSVGSPYPGLAGFGPGDAELFHGREHLVAEVLARLAGAPLLALVAEAGTGKSSLIRAGLLPAVSAGVLPDSARWRQVLVTPSTVDALGPLLAEPGPRPELEYEPAPPTAAEEAAEPVAEPEIAPDAEPAEEPPTTVDTQAAPEDPAEAPEPAQTLLVVDQFEEVFTLLDDDRRAEFLDSVVRATTTGRVVLALRSEFFPDCAEHPELARLVTANTVLIPPMTEDELHRAIGRPASLAAIAVEPALVDRLAAEVLDSGTADLTALAVTLRGVWRRRDDRGLTLAGYQDGPGLDAAVESYAEEVFRGLTSPAAREAGRVMLLGLSALTGSGVAVRVRRNLTELIGSAGPAGLSALEVLADGGLVTVWADADAVEIIHDVVVGEWPRLREWLAEAEAERGLRRQLSQAADAWAAGGRDPVGLYRGARLVTMLDFVERHGTELSTVEHDFLDAGNRLVMVAEARRRRRTVLLWKWLAATVAVAVLAVAVAAVAVAMQLRASARAEQADAARLVAAAQAEPDRRLSALLAVAATRLDSGTVGAAAEQLRRTPDLIAMAGTGVAALALSPDGRLLAVGGSAGDIALLRADNLAVSGTLSLPGHAPVNGLAFTPDGRRLISWAGAADRPDAASVVVWDVAARKPVGSAFGQSWPDRGGGLLADRSTLLLAQHGREPAASLIAWNIDARTPSTAYALPTAGVDTIVVSPDGRLVALGTPAATLVLVPATGATWSPATPGRPLAFSRDGSTLVLGEGAAVHLVDTATREVRTGGGAGHAAEVLAAGFAPDGASLATAGADGSILVWDVRAAHTVRAVAGFQRPVRSVVFGADGVTLYTVGDDGAVAAWDLQGTRGMAARLAAAPTSAPTLACAIAGRELTESEWSRFVPGRAYRRVCAA